MNDIIVKDDIKIEDLIYEIRGKQVMLDSDLANIYKVETKRINEAVKNNIEKFPERYCFQLTIDEFNILKSKISTSSLKEHGGRRYIPRVFTEQGIYMLATILKSKTAVNVTIAIMDAFVVMRKYINTNNFDKRLSNIETEVIENRKNIKLLQDAFNKLSTKEKVNHIFFDGEIYDAYSLLMDILGKAKKEIIIIDNYAGRELFDITRNIKVNIKIYTKNIDSMAKKKYEEEYNNITIINTDIFHDRFIILDNTTLYNLGSSLKDIGKKCTSINKIEDTNIIKNLLDRINNINNN